MNGLITILSTGGKGWVWTIICFIHKFLVTLSKLLQFILVCQQNFKKLAPRRNGLAEKLVSEKEQKKAYQEQEETNWSDGKVGSLTNLITNLKSVLQLYISIHLT